MENEITVTPVYDSAQRKHPAIEEALQVWRYRDLIKQLVRRDLTARYKRSVLGVAWTMLNPLGMMLVLTLVFSQLFKSTPGYPAYVLSGLIAWNFFAQSTTMAMNSLVWGGDLFERIYVPRSVFAVSAVGTGLVNLLLSLVPLLLVMLVVQVPIRVTALFAVVPIFFLACFALGVGLLLSSLAIYFYDIVEMYSNIILLAWMYLTPIIYPVEAIPDPFRGWLFYNPMTHLVSLFRQPLFYGTMPTFNGVWPSALISLGTLALGWFVFTQRSDAFAYRT
jgi:ABC-type polysaccharide/polyol phosphate export permease